jgi:hypothetical protein
MVLENICPPALIYIFFSLTHIIIYTLNGQYNTAFVTFWVALVFTVLLNYLCERGLGIISWIIVFIPFILMTVIIAILLLVFGIDPNSGRMMLPKTNINNMGQTLSSITDEAKQDITSAWDKVDNYVSQDISKAQQMLDPRQEARKRHIEKQIKHKKDALYQQQQQEFDKKIEQQSQYFDNYNDANMNTIQPYKQTNNVESYMTMM